MVDLKHLQQQQEVTVEQITKVLIQHLTPGDNRNAQSFPFDDLLACKKNYKSDVTFAIPRRNWVTGTTYDIYRHDYGDRITGTTTAQTSNSGVSTLHDANFLCINNC